MIDSHDKGRPTSPGERRKAARRLDGRLQRLREITESGGAPITLALAKRYGVSPLALQRLERRDVLYRVARGLYRFSDALPDRDAAVRDSLQHLGADAVLSHESALAFHHLSSIAPRFIHVTVPRAKRYLRSNDRLVIHTTSRPLSETDVATTRGVRVTTPARSIVDAAAAGTPWELIEEAVAEAFAEKVLTRSAFRRMLATVQPSLRGRLERLRFA